ncbi:hypothetical protein E2C01_091113 [Portunus trituberculatus]|uniref:Uncharacterized protein n=1 Tax=Portunus trituberculatus TaxID=210409 RepID=A0A5B7JU70_PORTR|nr:hypothetical protein [Portunus trituberculatus]
MMPAHSVVLVQTRLAELPRPRRRARAASQYHYERYRELRVFNGGPGASVLPGPVGEAVQLPGERTP